MPVVRFPDVFRLILYGVICLAVALAAGLLYGGNAAALVATFLIVGLCAVEAGDPKTSDAARTVLVTLAGSVALACGFFLEMTLVEHSIAVLFAIAVATFGRRLFVP